MRIPDWIRGGRWPRVLPAVATAMLAWSGTAHSERATVQSFVNAAQQSGQPWSGCGDIMLGPFFSRCGNSAPSPVLCVVTATRSYTCRNPGPDGSLVSPCAHSQDCEFRHVELPPDRIFGLVIVSSGLLGVKLIDAVTVTREPMDDESGPVVAMDRILRETAGDIARTIWPDEIARRARPFPVIGIGDCIVRGCNLRQSTVLLRLENAGRAVATRNPSED